MTGILFKGITFTEGYMVGKVHYIVISRNASTSKVIFVREAWDIVKQKDEPSLWFRKQRDAMKLYRSSGSQGTAAISGVV